MFSGGAVLAAVDARSIEAVQFTDGCAAGLATPTLVLDGRGVFRYAGRLNSSVRVTLVGRFINPKQASLRIHFQGVLCEKEPFQVTARLS